MKHAHIDGNGQILGWYDPQIHNDIPEPNYPVTDEVWQNAINNSHNTLISGKTSVADHRTLDQKTIDARTQRDALLTTIVDPIVTNPLRWGTMTSDEQQMWVNYRQALLDVPQQPGFPASISWPNKP